jgi:hypothetical protein
MEGESFSFRRTLQGGLAECLQAPELGGLGLPNLELMGYALRLRWMWHRKTGTNKPWITLPGKLEQPLSHIFHYSTTVNVGMEPRRFFGRTGGSRVARSRNWHHVSFRPWP